MDSFNSFISVNLVGTDEQIAAGVESLRLIVGGGEIHIFEGFWQLEPLEKNIKIVSWTNDLDSLVVKIAKYMRVYQSYASQESVFVTYKDSDRHEARIVYAGEWDQLVLEVDRGSYLAEYFSPTDSFDLQADIYDGRDEYPNH